MSANLPTRRYEKLSHRMPEGMPTSREDGVHRAHITHHPESSAATDPNVYVVTQRYLRRNRERDETRLSQD